MIGALARGLWRLFGRRLGWMALATAARTLLRRRSSTRVDRAAAEIEDRLPERVRTAIEVLPGDPVRRGGQAVVAGRSARQVATGAGRLTRAADRGRRRVADTVEVAASVVDRRPRPVETGHTLAERLGDEIRSESERTRRRLRSRMLGHSRGPTAADDALLDRRHGGADDALLDRRHGGADDALSDRRHGGAGGVGRGDERLDLDELGPDPWDDVPDPVRPGRVRARRRRSEPTVARVQRTYRRPRRPWDR